MKVYLVCVLDVWNNVTEIGYFKSLDDPELLDNINSFLEGEIVVDEEENEIEDFKLEPGDLVEYMSTFGYCFDKEIMFKDSGYLRIFGFIYDIDDLIKELTIIKNN